ncbi:5-formyltetrahydrofolate cyclo-ligase [Haloimpatiens sp. FM7315]|uniref:5-formyltetrahydrofolate cyclo-ligase n=1 Tax=Haloimpatiens sp. FM7315 TaxID=3298609 RepID=UPI00370A4361
MEKRELRKKMNSKRKNLPKDFKNSLDKKIYNKIVLNKNFIKANSVFLFVSYNNEVDTHKIILKALSENKIVSVPKVISKEKGMVALEIKSFKDLEIGAYGILEPKENCKIIDPSSIDFALIPGLAFDENGNRLGYGGGFYDRFLNLMTNSSHKVGISYDFQIVNEIPIDANDMKITELVTDKKVVKFN